MEKKNFKKKLTLSISGSTKKRSEKIEYAKNQNNRFQDDHYQNPCTHGEVPGGQW